VGACRRVHIRSPRLFFKNILADSDTIKIEHEMWNEVTFNIPEKEITLSDEN